MGVIKQLATSRLTLHISAAREATSLREINIAATCFQLSAVAARGEWRDGLCWLKLTFTLLNRTIHF